MHGNITLHLVVNNVRMCELFFWLVGLRPSFVQSAYHSKYCSSEKLFSHSYFLWFGIVNGDDLDLAFKNAVSGRLDHSSSFVFGVRMGI